MPIACYNSWVVHYTSCRDGGTGRRTGLKIQRWRQRAGSIPAPGTTLRVILKVFLNKSHML
jgi:hypothetical protein